MKRKTLQWRVKKFLQRGYLIRIGFGHEGKCIPILVNPSGTADAVDVVIRALGHIVVDDVGDTQYINTAGGDIGSHQNFNRAVTEPIECGLSPVLGEVSL
jgi:hypothetical protein